MCNFLGTKKPQGLLRLGFGVGDIARRIGIEDLGPSKAQETQLRFRDSGLSPLRNGGRLYLAEAGGRGRAAEPVDDGICGLDVHVRILGMPKHEAQAFLALPHSESFRIT
jgi:hypothetical protein